MTLESFLGECFDNELKASWNEACTIIQRVMESATTHAVGYQASALHQDLAKEVGTFRL